MKENFRKVQSRFENELNQRFEMPLVLSQVGEDYALAKDVYDQLSSEEIKYWEQEFSNVGSRLVRWNFEPSR